jgi:ABC-type multidrug transport system permease subunit
MVTPIGSLGLMLGKIAPYAVIGFLDFLLVVTAMQLVFNVPIAGSIVLHFVLSAGSLLAALGLGLLARARQRRRCRRCSACSD